MSEYESAGAADLAPGELRQVTLKSGVRVCVGNADGHLFAVGDKCPHSEFSLSEGALLPGGILECTWHGAQFDCRNGDVLKGPADEPVQVYVIKTHEGELFVQEDGV